MPIMISLSSLPDFELLPKACVNEATDILCLFSLSSFKINFSCPLPWIPAYFSLSQNP